MKKLVIFCLMALGLISCDSSEKTHIVGRYYLEDIKMSGEFTSLYYKVDDNLSQGIIREKVYAAGFNDKFIIVKQHPILNSKTVYYYIVKIYKEQTYWAEKGIIGPLTFEQFKEKRIELQISDDVKFTINIEN